MTTVVLQESLAEFQAALTPDQIKELNTYKAVPDVDAVLQFTAQLDARNSHKGRYGVSSRLITVLQSVQQFSKVVETFVSSNPTVAALVWGSIKFTFLVRGPYYLIDLHELHAESQFLFVSNYFSYFDKFTSLFMRFNSLCPLFEKYQVLYRYSPELQTSLCLFHASIVRCCKSAVDVIQRKWSTKFFTSLYLSFESEFESLEANVKTCSKDVEKQIAFAERSAADQERQLQVRERQAASRERRLLRGFVARSDAEDEKFREWRIQRDERQAARKRQQLVDSLSTYDYMTDLKQARRRWQVGTAKWLPVTPEYKRWEGSAESSVFWCSGKLGSGKTILTAKVIDHILTQTNSGSGVQVGFFFCQFDKDASLKSETILHSIVRQFLDPSHLPKDIEDPLENFSRSPLSSNKELRTILDKMTKSSQRSYILIDALDECEKTEREIVLEFLQTVLASAQSNVKLFLSSRDSIRDEVRRFFPLLEHQSMGSPEALNDISEFIRESIRIRLDKKKLQIGSQEIIVDIQDSLTQGADGMFLWVKFQLDDICSQPSDEKIRETLRNLPRDLAETFNRALHKTISNGHQCTAHQAFQWVAAVKRPLSLGQLCEAMAIEPCQSYTKPEKFINDPNRIAGWCENLIVIDEEESMVQFAHHSVKRHILEKSKDEHLHGLHVDLENADHEIGEVCVTYLNFNDFNTQLMARPREIQNLDITAIPETVFQNEAVKRTKTKLIKSVASRVYQFPSKANKSVNIQSLFDLNSKSNKEELMNLDHPFLTYASQNWLLHTTRFEPSRSKSWSLWTHMLNKGHNLGFTPWTTEEFDSQDHKFLEWVVKERHLALIRLSSSKTVFSDVIRNSMVETIFKTRGGVSIEFLLEIIGREKQRVNATLRHAVEVGYIEVFDSLVMSSTVDLDQYDREHDELLHLAAENGHSVIVDRLLAANAEVDPSIDNGRNTLCLAAKNGHYEVVDRLLAAGAKVDAVSYGETALRLVTEYGHYEVVKRLLAENANPKSVDERGRTAMKLAKEHEHCPIVKVLKSAGATE